MASAGCPGANSRPETSPRRQKYLGKVGCGVLSAELSSTWAIVAIIDSGDDAAPAFGHDETILRRLVSPDTRPVSAHRMHQLGAPLRRAASSVRQSPRTGCRMCPWRRKPPSANGNRSSCDCGEVDLVTERHVHVEPPQAVPHKDLAESTSLPSVMHAYHLSWHQGPPPNFVPLPLLSSSLSSLLASAPNPVSRFCPRGTLLYHQRPHHLCRRYGQVFISPIVLILSLSNLLLSVLRIVQAQPIRTSKSWFSISELNRVQFVLQKRSGL